MRVIGVDCAVAPEKTGIALARWEDMALTIEATESGSEDRTPLEIVLEHLEPVTLLALDAPLGWPAEFGSALGAHRAGESIPVERNAFFRRRTDDFVAEKLGKRPMDVSADRIARTAYAALALLDGIRRAGWEPCLLAWSPEEAARGVHAIETYPAGWLVSRGLPFQGYKAADQRDRRRVILGGLRAEYRLEAAVEPLLEDADQLDAALCTAAAADFLLHRGTPPTEPEVAKKEGWIWTRLPD